MSSNLHKIMSSKLSLQHLLIFPSLKVNLIRTFSKIKINLLKINISFCITYLVTYYTKCVFLIYLLNNLIK